MASRAAEIELLSLKKIREHNGDWQFQVKYHDQLDSLLLQFAEKGLFRVKGITASYFTDPETYEISDEGMWLISHLFTNWEEMKAKAEQVPPEHVNCRANFAEQGEPEQKKEPVFGSPCVECGASESLKSALLITPCPECGKPVCGHCVVAHAKTHQYARKCSECGKGYGEIFAPIYTCQDCKKDVCVLCEFEHKAKHKQPKHRCSACGDPTTTECDECHMPYCSSCFDLHKAKVHEEPSFKYCSGCNTIYPDEKTWHCEHCGFYYCVKCKLAHMITSCPRNSYTYTNRQEYGSSGPTLDDINELMDRLKRSQAWSFDFGSWQTDKEETDTYKQHYRNAGQQQSQQQSTDNDIPTTVPAAFKRLGLSTSATVQQVKQSFRTRAKTAHPDTGGSDEVFKSLNAACQMALQYIKERDKNR